MAVKNTLSFAVFCLALLQTQSAASETIAFEKITATQLLPLSVANGISVDEVSELFGEFDAVSVFESKRMLEAAMEKIIADSSAYKGSSVVSVQVSYLMPVSQFDFESSSFAVCIPRVMFAAKDLPLASDLPIYLQVGGFEYEVSGRGIDYKKRDGHSRVADVSGDDFHWVCKNGDILDSVEFTESGLSVTDLSQAENFDANVNQVGDGFVAARLTCDLVSFEAGGQLKSFCQATKMELYSTDDFSMNTPLFEGTYGNP